MFDFDLRTTQVWVTVALLMLCVSIHPLSSYPFAEEDQDLTAVKENVDHEGDQELVYIEDEALEEGMAIVEEAMDVENAPSWDCSGPHELCFSDERCCDNSNLVCDPSKTKFRTCITKKT